MDEYDRMAHEVILDYLDSEIEFSDVYERDDVQSMTESGVEEIHRRAEIIRQGLLAGFEARIDEDR